MKSFKLISLSFILIVFMDINNVNASGNLLISYTVTFPEAQAHYADIEMNISGLKQNTLNLKMPVWTPGSYLVREFSKNVESFSAMAGGTGLQVHKISKNCWQVQTAGRPALTVKYRVYCFEISVRTSFIDVSHAFLCNTGIFIYPDKMLDQPSTVHLVPYKGWSKVSTSLPMVNNDAFTRRASNYDILFDSPIEIGNQDIFGFNAAGVKYEVAMVGGGNYDKDRLTKDIARIVGQETAVFGENPNKYYLFLVHNYLRGGGGLEHLSSTTLGASRDSYLTEAGYKNFLSLVAHEHFHLWNVKRLRPFALGPFDYDKENYTTDLWIAEGFTAYYQNIILRHADLTTADYCLNALAGVINVVENQPGAKVQPLAEASFDAWIKAYRPNEKSYNSNISYYDKGAVVAMLLDLEIINNSNGRHSLDDVMKYMYVNWYKLKKRGYTDAEFKHGLEQFAGENLDDFYAKYVNGLSAIDYNKYLGYAGYQLTGEPATGNDPSLRVSIANINGKKTVIAVARGGAGWIGGINVNDEIIAIDTTQVTDEATMLNGKKTGDKIIVKVNRDGLPLNLPVTLLKNDRIKYKIDSLTTASPKQLTVRKKWLNL